MSITAGDLRCQYNNKDAYCIGCRLKLHYKFSQTETGSFASFPELVTPGGCRLPLSASAVGGMSAGQAIFLVAKFRCCAQPLPTARERSTGEKRTRILTGLPTLFAGWQEATPRTCWCKSRWGVPPWRPIKMFAS